jgi:hypothetical protein
VASTFSILTGNPSTRVADVAKRISISFSDWFTSDLDLYTIPASPSSTQNTSTPNSATTESE